MNVIYGETKREFTVIDIGTGIIYTYTDTGYLSINRAGDKGTHMNLQQPTVFGGGVALALWDGLTKKVDSELAKRRMRSFARL